MDGAGHGCASGVTDVNHDRPDPRPASTHDEPPSKKAKALPNHLFLTCPKCPHKLSGTKEAFCLNNLDSRIWCNQCRRSWYTKKWQCPCHLPWHTCQLHRHEPARLQLLQPPTPKPTTPAQPRQRPKRQMGQGRDEHIQQWIDAPPPKRTRPPPQDVELELTSSVPSGPNLAFMGPKLRAKFAHLTQPGNSPGHTPTLTGTSRQARTTVTQQPRQQDLIGQVIDDRS